MRQVLKIAKLLQKESCSSLGPLWTTLDKIWLFVVVVIRTYRQPVETLQTYFHILRVRHPMQYTEVLQSQKAKESYRPLHVSSSTKGQGQTSVPELFNKARKYERTTKQWCDITFPTILYNKEGSILTLSPKFGSKVCTKCHLRSISLTCKIPALYIKKQGNYIVSADVANTRYFSATTDTYVVQYCDGTVLELRILCILLMIIGGFKVDTCKHFLYQRTTLLITCVMC